MPMKTSFAVLTLTVLTFVAPGQARAAVILGQVQTFDDPDHHWVIGAGPVQSSPTMLPLALGGPGGPADPWREFHRPAGETRAWSAKLRTPGRSFARRPVKLVTGGASGSSAWTAR